MKKQSSETLLLTHQEIEQIQKHSTISDVYLAKDIVSVCAEQQHIKLSNQPFEFWVLLGVVLKIGMIMGIRQERERRRRKKNDNRITMV